MQTVVTITAYVAFGQVAVLITERQTTETGSAYRLITNEMRPLPVAGTDPTADILNEVAMACWQAGDRIQQAAF